MGVVVSGELTQASAFPHETWHLFSVPFSAADADLTPFLDTAVGENSWVADTWNGTENVRTAPVATLGQPFWLITTQQFRSKLNGTVANPAESQTLPLRQGWNLVANPFPFPVSFGNIRVDAKEGLLPLDKQSAVRPRFWRWKDTSPNDKTDGAYEMITDFSAPWEPWSGYWVFADAAEATLRVEPFTNPLTATPSAPPQPSVDWLGTLSIGNARGVSRVQFALSKGAGWDYDSLDIEQPPSRTNTSLSLLQKGMRFQRVALPLSVEEWVWEAELCAVEKATLLLSDAPPAGYHLYLERLDDGSRIPLLPHRSVPVPDGRHRARFRLTKQRLGWDVTDVVPNVTQLLPNYPNPFNPETWIPFTLSEEKAVGLEIYDARGRRVRQLSLGFLPAGRYSEKGRALYWDGRNEVGELVASGVYFVELQAGQYRGVRRIVLLK